jgi:hypothetical protein
VEISVRLSEKTLKGKYIIKYSRIKKGLLTFHVPYNIIFSHKCVYKVFSGRILLKILFLDTHIKGRERLRGPR